MTKKELEQALMESNQALIKANSQIMRLQREVLDLQQSAIEKRDNPSKWPFGYPHKMVQPFPVTCQEGPTTSLFHPNEAGTGGTVELQANFSHPDDDEATGVPV